jgi:hypothetical protein
LRPWPTWSSTTHSSLCWVTLWRRFTDDGLWCTRGRAVCCCGDYIDDMSGLSVEQHKKDWKSKQKFLLDKFVFSDKQIADIVVNKISTDIHSSYFS